MSEENNRDEKLKQEGEPQLSGIGKWLDNFWYHYKAQTIIAAVLIITAVISISQLVKRESYDYTLLYAGPRGLAVQDIVYMEQAFSEVAADYDGNGTVAVTVSDVLMLSEQEVADARAEGIALDPNFLRNSMNEYSQQIIGGDAVICMLSPYVHGMLVEAGGLMKMTDVLGEAPENAYGEYGILLADTDFGAYFNGVNDLPEDTVLCIRTLSTAAGLKGRKKTERAHAASVELFKTVVGFEAPEVESHLKSETMVEN